MEYATGSGRHDRVPQEIGELLQLLAQAHVELEVHNNAQRDQKLLQASLGFLPISSTYHSRRCQCQ
jgi:hypothetical protein